MPGRFRRCSPVARGVDDTDGAQTGVLDTAIDARVEVEYMLGRGDHGWQLIQVAVIHQLE